MADIPKPKERVDYSQVRVIGNEDGERAAKQLADLERKIRDCKREYDLWFFGTNPMPPHAMRSALDRHVRLIRNKLPTQTADAFKVGVVLQRYQTLVEHWDKSTKAQEEGGGPLWMARGGGHKNPLQLLEEANEERQSGAQKPKKSKKSDYLARITSPEGDEDEMRKVFNSYVAAKKKVGEDVGGASFDKFRAVLTKQTKSIIDTGKGSAVNYRIEVDGGKVSIKAKAEK